MAKPKDHKVKNFYYRRAVWDGQKSRTLESYLLEAHERFDIVGERTFGVDNGGEIRGARFEDNDGIFLQVAAYVPGANTSVIDKSIAVKASDVSASEAPDNYHYLDGDIFVYVKGNDVILCPSGVRENVAKKYITNILKKSKFEEVSKSFTLDVVARVDKIKMIEDEGVKKVELKSSLYEASLIHLDRKSPKVSNLAKVFADEIASLFSKDKDLKEIQEEENLNVDISISFDGREARKHLKEIGYGDDGKKRLKGTARKVIEQLNQSGDEGFVIVTGNDNKITFDDVRVSSPYKVKILGKSLSRESAWVALKFYYDELRKSGILNQ